MSHNTNKVALVTGVSSGIGREIAQLLAERRMHVFGTRRVRLPVVALREGAPRAGEIQATPAASLQQVLDRGLQVFGILGPVAIDF
jgi:NAD(P)-dependent dehydrogenase (short-subunit alcohol dehydrogenase family)